MQMDQKITPGRWPLAADEREMTGTKPSRGGIAETAVTL